MSIADFFILAFITVTKERRTQLHYALSERFQDLDEIKDVAKYGCQGGVPKFIYHKEIQDFYFEYQHDICDKMEELGLTLKDAPRAPPEETPMSPGSTRGLRKRPWSAAPEIPRAAPTKTPRKTLGNLITLTIADEPDMAVGSAPRVRLSPCQMAEIGISTGPVRIEIIKATRAMPPSIQRASTRFVFDRLDK